MNQQTITLTHLPDILLVVLPEEAKEYHIAQDYQGSYLCWDDGTTDFERQQFGDHGQFKFCDNPRNNWRIVSTLADLTEEWCKGVVDGELNGMRTKMVYKHYKGLPMWFFTALESFHSAIRASGWYLESPVKVHTWASENADDYKKQFDEAQSRTLNPELTLILEKI